MIEKYDKGSLARKKPDKEIKSMVACLNAKCKQAIIPFLKSFSCYYSKHALTILNYNEVRTKVHLCLC